MRIEALTEFLHGRERYMQGDVRTVADDLGAYFCQCGWAKDLDGNVETGNPGPTDVILAPDSVVHGLNTESAGG